MSSVNLAVTSDGRLKTSPFAAVSGSSLTNYSPIKFDKGAAGLDFVLWGVSCS